MFEITSITHDRARNRIVLHIGMKTELAVSPDEFEKFETRIRNGESKPFKKLKPTFPTMFEDLELDAETKRQINDVISAFKLKSGDSI